MKVIQKIADYKTKYIDNYIKGASPNLIKVILKDNSNNLIRKLKLKVIDVSEIYESINKGKSINISECYIKNFSLRNYRKIYNLDDNEIVELNNFNITNSLFDSKNVIDFSFSKFTGNSVSFNNSHFGKGKLTFYSAIFKTKEIDFKNTSYSCISTSFQYANFREGIVNFDNSYFNNGNVFFINTLFNNGLTSFKNVFFGKGTTIFRFSEFGKNNIRFDKSCFKSSFLDFSKINFGEGKIDFRKCDFENTEISFEESELKNGKLLFRRAKFGDKPINFRMLQFYNSSIILDEAEFGAGRVSFLESSIKLISIKNSILYNYIDFRVKQCKTIDLSDAIIQNIVDFKVGISKVNINTLYLCGVRNLGKIFISWKENNVYKLIENQNNSSFSQKAEQFRLLKEDFNNLGRYEDEDRAYIEFKRNELKNIVSKHKGLKIHKKIAHIIKFGIQKVIFDWMGLYATSPLRVLFSIFVIYGSFSLSYAVSEIMGYDSLNCIEENSSIFSILVDSFYFSAVTWLTIGYGDCVPVGFWKNIVPFEGWIGVFMMSYLSVAFVRKILR